MRCCVVVVPCALYQEKAAVGEAEAKLNEALRRAKRERDKAEAVGKEEAEAKNVAQRYLIGNILFFVRKKTCH